MERRGGWDGGVSRMPVRPIGRCRRPWNKGLLIGQKKPLEPKHLWSIRVTCSTALLHATYANASSRRNGVANMLFNLLDGGHVDQRTNRNTWLEPVTDLERANCLGQTLDKHVVDLVLRQDAIDANAGLAGITVFRRHRAPDCGIDVRIVED